MRAGITGSPGRNFTWVMKTYDETATIMDVRAESAIALTPTHLCPISKGSPILSLILEIDIIDIEDVLEKFKRI